MPIVLYRRQKQILNFLKSYIAKYSYAPTLAEIAEAINVSSLATVHEHIQALVKKGVVKKFEGTVRGMEVLDLSLAEKLREIELPVLGFIAAGQPIMPYTDPDATIVAPASMVTGRKKSFVLQVKGDSMIEDGILDGDYVVIEEQNYAHDGNIVVAILDNGLATLKRFFREVDRIRLEPANSSMQPIFATNVQIQGKCVGVIRRYNSSF